MSVRVICATHRDLENMAAKGLFREDLMYRLTVLTLNLPSLRNHKEDIPLLAKVFISRAAAQIGCSVPQLTEQALSILVNQQWPGNVRQLQNTLFRVVALTQAGEIGAEQLADANVGKDTEVHADEPESWKSAQAQFEKDLLARLYKSYPSTRKLARRLQVSHTTIADKLRLYGISSSN